MLTTALGDDYYSGDATPSSNKPATGPGRPGINNAMAPSYCNLSAFATISPQPPVLWTRGANDQIVSDTPFLDLGYLGRLGAVPGWPGAGLFPPQPMVAQTRAVLERFRTYGGRYEELVIAAAGHSPFLEQPEVFLGRYTSFLAAN